MKRSDVVWYAIRVTYSREMALKEYLDTLQVENFIPMRYELVNKGGKSVKKLVPIVHNLIFVKSSRTVIDTVKMDVESKAPMRYMMDKSTNQPIIVPNQQMQHFIAVAGSLDEQLIYLDPTEINFKKKDKVRIIGGLFAGVEGEFVRIRGDRRVVVAIPGVVAVATTYVHPSLLVPVD